MKLQLWQQMLLGLVVGVVIGLVAKEHATILKPVGDAFLSLLNMLVVLVIFSSMSTGVMAIDDMRKLGRIGVKTIILYLLTTAIAIGIGLGLASIMKVGSNLHLVSQATNTTHVPIVSEALQAMIPSNPIKAMAEGKILQVIVFAIIAGIAMNIAKEKAKPLVKVIVALNDVMHAMTSMVMRLAPFGICALMAAVAGTFGTKILYPLFQVLSAHYIGCALHMVIVFGGILCLLRLPIQSFYKGMADAIAIAASTSSSAATLPATLHCAQMNLGISKNIAQFTLPLGATVNMNGTAMFQSIATLFIAHAYHIPLGGMQLLMIMITATFASIGCAGIPGGALVTLSVILSSVGLPLEGIVILAGIDRLRDIIGTVVNVLGDVCVALYVAKSEHELDEKTYYSKNNIKYQKK